MEDDQVQPLNATKSAKLKLDDFNQHAQRMWDRFMKIANDYGSLIAEYCELLSNHEALKLELLDMKAPDQTQLVQERDKALDNVARLTQDGIQKSETLLQKQGVITYLQEQVIALQDENRALLNRSAISDERKADDKESRENDGSASLKSTTTETQRHLKLPDPPIFDDGNNITLEHWLVKMRSKMEFDADLMPTEAFRMAYVQSRVGGGAFGQLERRLRKNAARPLRNTEEMLSCLEGIYGNPH
ncbi:hypothetical protein MMC22_002176 [Lobaria immixta]|nr:hypothetical protein [Lobaria immixta]